VSIVVINYRSIEKLRECLNELLKTSYPNFEIIVVDSLTPGIESFVREKYPFVKLIHFHDKDPGASASHNIGAILASSSSKYLAFIDNDVRVTSDWLNVLVDHIEKNGRCKMVASSLKTSDGQILSAGAFIDLLGNTYNIKKFQGSVNKPSCIRGAAFLCPKDIYFQLGGYDPYFFLYYDDTDFCIRLLKKGYRIHVLRDSTLKIIEQERDSLQHRKPSTKTIYFLERNRIYFIIKNYPLLKIIHILPVLLIHYLLLVSYFLIRKNVVLCVALFRAIFDTLKNFKTIIINRNNNKLKLTIKDINYLIARLPLSQYLNIRKLNQHDIDTICTKIPVFNENNGDADS